MKFLFLLANIALLCFTKTGGVTKLIIDTDMVGDEININCKLSRVVQSMSKTVLRSCLCHKEPVYSVYESQLHLGYLWLPELVLYGTRLLAYQLVDIEGTTCN